MDLLWLQLGFRDFRIRMENDSVLLLMVKSPVSKKPGKESFFFGYVFDVKFKLRDSRAFRGCIAKRN
jgi:hypothetical protein